MSKELSGNCMQYLLLSVDRVREETSHVRGHSAEENFRMLAFEKRSLCVYRMYYTVPYMEYVASAYVYSISYYSACQKNFLYAIFVRMLAFEKRTFECWHSRTVVFYSW